MSFHVVRRALVAGVFAVATSLTFASVGSDSDASRIALKERQYAQVLVLTERVAQSEPRMTLNWYRMAIAATRLGNFVLGNEALKTAISLDPSLSFASTPLRVEKLQEDIKAGLAGATAVAAQPGASAPMPGASAPAMSVEQMEEADPSATEVKAAVASAVADVAFNLSQIDKRFAALEKTTIDTKFADRERMSQSLSIWIIGFCVLGLLLAVVVAFVIGRSIRKIRQERVKTIATMPLEELVAFNRDNAFMLMQRLAVHGHKETALYQALVRTIPALELESGKARINMADLTRGKALSDTGKKLAPRQMVLGKDDPQKLHSSVVQRLLTTVPKRLKSS